MTCITYINKNFAAASMAIVDQANFVIEEYAAQGYDLTLRQLYYQFVARGWIENSQRSYKRLGSIVNDARLAGLVSWDAIKDRTRHIRERGHWEHPSQVLIAARNSFYMDKWHGQANRVEVWIEKDALIGVIEPLCRELDVACFSCRGYVSQSEMWTAAQRLRRYEANGLNPVILHLGDHDPSGVDMSRDIGARLETFESRAEVQRIALTMPQVEEVDPPPNPAKITDTRAADYIDRYGRESWELDALEPSYLTKLIKSFVLPLRNEEQYQYVLEVEKAHIATIDSLIERIERDQVAAKRVFGIKGE